MHIDDLDTPCVLIDLDRVERNVRRWQEFCDKAGLANRPHVKTHKIAELARLQREAGAAGITCQKLGEAEVMADAGQDDILITFNLIGTQKIARAVELAKRVKLRVTCDNEPVAQGLSGGFAADGSELGVLVECDTGAHRCGVQSPEEAVALAEAIDRLPGLRFDGWMTYPPPRRQPGVTAFFEEASARAAASGIEAHIVSNGGTPDMWTADRVTAATEHRAGTYIYNDRSMVACRAASFDDCAMRVLTTVVSRPTAGRVILDAGSKTLTSDLLGLEGHGYVVEYPEAVIAKLSEEHGHADFGACNGCPSIGDRVSVIPNHTCVVSNMFDRVHGVRGDRVEKTFEVCARGRLQ